MKIKSFLLFLLPVLFLSCQNQLFLPNPSIFPDDDKSIIDDGSWHAPRDLTASQGKKRKISLTWKPVKEAKRYYIYRAESEFSTFKQVGETRKQECEFEIKTRAGFDMYYRVTAIDNVGNESEMSNVVRATTLTTPIINDIFGQEGFADSNVYVSWYMNNVDAYSDKVHYNVICYDENNKQVQNQRSRGLNTKVLFTNLAPKTNYSYKVIAYISDTDVEESAVVDAMTARRTRPDPVTDLIIQQGLSKDSIKLSFKLPNYVDVMVKKNEFNPKAVYFKIYRRPYKEGENHEEFKLISNDFYKNIPFNEYEPGKEVEYIDSNSTDITDELKLKRGIKYEYKIQSFVNIDRDVSSDLSVTTSIGWLLPDFNFATKSLEYTKVNEIKTGAKLGFLFDIDTFNINYKYKITEYKKGFEPTDKYDQGTALKFIGEETITSNAEDVKNKIHTFDLSKNDGGYFKYKLSVLQEDGTEIDSKYAIGEILVTKNNVEPKFGDIKVTTGYPDKIRIEWPWNPTYKYKLVINDDSNKPVTHEEIMKNQDISKGVVIYDDLNVIPGEEKQYQLKIDYSGFESSGPIMKGVVPEKPKLIPTYYYDKVSVKIDKKSKNNYEVKTEFVDKSLETNYKLVQLKNDNPYEYEIKRKEESVTQSTKREIDSEIAGTKIKYTVTEKRDLTTQIYNSKSENVKKIADTSASGTSPTKTESISLTSEIVTSYVGQALLNTQASKGIDFDSISVSWKKVDGANGYVILRDRYHIEEDGKLKLKTVFPEKYVVNIEENGKPTISAPSEVDKLENYVLISYDNNKELYTFTDKYRPEQENDDTTNAWIKGQSEIIWGAPYNYTVIPVIKVEDNVEKDSQAKTIKINNTVTFNNIQSDLGGTKGFGWNVISSKGSYSDSTATDLSGNRTNNAIKVTWTSPYFGNKDGYAIFRKEKNESTWQRLNALVNGNEFVDKIDSSDNSILQGKIYDYAVVDINYKEKQPNQKFLDDQNKIDEISEMKKSFGFVLPMPSISKVSRTNEGVGKEIVTFTAVSIDNNFNELFDGYVIQVRNNNIDNKWHDIKVIELTTGNKDKNVFEDIVVEDPVLLKVLRDYKHYFRIRAYKNSSDVPTGKIYSLADETFENNMDTNYVKWGCREISNEEFTRAINLLITEGVYDLWENGKSNSSISYTRYSSLATPKAGTFKFNSYKKDLTTKAGVPASFLKITGNLSTEAWGLYYPTKYQSDKMNISCEISNDKFYTGTIQFYNDGKMTVTYNNETKTYSYNDEAGKYCPLIIGHGALPLKNFREYLNNSEAWK